MGVYMYIIDEKIQEWKSLSDYIFKDFYGKTIKTIELKPGAINVHFTDGEVGLVSTEYDTFLCEKCEATFNEQIANGNFRLYGYIQGHVRE